MTPPAGYVSSASLAEVSAPRPPRTLTWRLLVALLTHPELWWTAVRSALRLAPPGWWRRSPRLPLPDPSYLRFRYVTAYGGDGDGPPEPSDLIAYLQWCRAWPDVIAGRR